MDQEMSLPFGQYAYANPAAGENDPPPPPRTPEPAEPQKAGTPKTPRGAASPAEVRTSGRKSQPRDFLKPSMEGPRSWAQVPRSTLVSIAEGSETREMQAAKPAKKPRTKKVAAVKTPAEIEAEQRAQAEAEAREAEAKKNAEARQAEAKELAKKAEDQKKAELKAARANRLAEAKKAKAEKIAQQKAKEAEAKELAEAQALKESRLLAHAAGGAGLRAEEMTTETTFDFMQPPGKGKEAVDAYDRGDDIMNEMLQNEDEQMRDDEALANALQFEEEQDPLVGSVGGVGGVGGPARLPKKPPMGPRVVVPHKPKHGVIHPPPGVRMHGISKGGVFKGPPKRRLEVGCTKWHTSFPAERRAKKRKNAAQKIRFKVAKYAADERAYYVSLKPVQQKSLRDQYKAKLAEMKAKVARLAEAKQNAKGTQHFKMAAAKWSEANKDLDQEIMAVNLAEGGEDELCHNHKAIYAEYKQLMKKPEWQQIAAGEDASEEEEEES